jgi:hypothetical protein
VLPERSHDRELARRDEGGQEQGPEGLSPCGPIHAF